MIKQIRDFPDYAVSDSGNVYSIQSDGLKELRRDISNGYPRVKLNGKKYYVANLVADHFLSYSKPNDNYHLFYVDSDPNNCNVDNLVWLTQSDIKRYSQYTVEYRREMLGRW